MNTALNLYYTGLGRQRERAPLPFPAPRSTFDPACYIPTPELISAVNVAVILGQPLLVTGEPGVGKTHLAYSVAAELGLHGPLRVDVKSTSTAADLFYHFDVLGRFRDAQSGVRLDGPSYLTFTGLGKAIVLANDPQTVRDIIGPHQEELLKGPLRSLVLIDEIDKAPRDVPNDILSELEGMQFAITELGNRVVFGSPAQRPIIIFTSNSEKALPDAFLRRCVYYNIPFPSPELLERIVIAHLPGKVPDPLIRDAVEFFIDVRQKGLRKVPGTAELLLWLQVLQMRGGEQRQLTIEMSDTLGVIAKTESDRISVGDLFRTWIEARRRFGGSNL
jgi:MoxR-like ATPase